MHEDSPKMSVAQGLVASSSQAKNEIAMEVPEYEITCVETKSTENIEMELKISYVNPTSDRGHEALGKRFKLCLKKEKWLYNNYIYIVVRMH
ncbi:Nuclear hormone receptor FTZ-F1 [Papilio machaon]|uniref:Nuclear hormone receptor FTZ-F1 n=1 Tax=Papilio machaon TaxID=76193 RepID=A0A194QLU5_PAPMA|nr:Nuclear hormone receptor FTZ-F1 [Papilio machaon]